jgi:hypothetical protein
MVEESRCGYAYLSIVPCVEPDPRLAGRTADFARLALRAAVALSTGRFGRYGGSLVL